MFVHGMVLVFPWKIVMIVSKLVYDLFAELTNTVVIIRLLSISRTSQYDPLTMYINIYIYIYIYYIYYCNKYLKPPPLGYNLPIKGVY